MLDCQLWGLNAGGHHLTNVLLHAANAVLLFLLLRRMTGAWWRSVFVAAVFAVHPLDAESVAWVAQCKNVLSTFFWLLTMGAYVGYVCKPGWQRYGLVVVCYVMGLMSKPMLVTLPFVLCLLDYWPLQRVSSARATGGMSSTMPLQSAARLAFEKVPLLALAVVSSVVTYLGQKSLGAVATLEHSPFGVRLAKVPVNYVTYLWKTVWPEGLAIPYPYPLTFSVSTVALCILLLVGVTLLVLRTIKSKPYMAVGWFWFLGTMVPVIGLLQVGNTPVADRFTYVPQIGLYVLLTWSAADLCARLRHRRWITGGLSMVILVALIFCAHKQASYWRNSEVLWTHTLACTSDNDTAQYNLAEILLKKGRVGEAITHFKQSLQINPGAKDAQNDLGGALFQSGNVDEAIVHYQQALQINPDHADAHYNLGNALLQKGNVAEAIVHYQQALQINPNFADAQNNLAWELATAAQASLRNGQQAMKLAQQANQLAGGQDPVVLRTLAAACAEAGRFGDARQSAQKAMDLARAAGQTDQMKMIEGELKLYTAGLPFHQENK